MKIKAQYLIAALLLIISTAKSETDFEEILERGFGRSNDKVDYNAIFSEEFGSNLNLERSNDKIDYKAKFGEEFGSYLKEIHAELLHLSMTRFKELFNNLLRDTNPSQADRKRFAERLETVQEIENQIGHSFDVPLMKRLKEFGKIVTMELLLYRFSALADGEAVQRIFEASAELEKKDAKVFKEKMYKKYHEMFKKLPSEELYRHYQYEEIDDLLERISSCNLNEAGTLESVLENASVFRKLGEFFEYPEYQELFA